MSDRSPKSKQRDHLQKKTAKDKAGRFWREIQAGQARPVQERPDEGHEI